MNISPLITVVCGLPRSGTSLMMQILEAAGIPCAGDYPAFEPDGYHPPTDDLLDLIPGGAFKLLDPHRHPLPIGRRYQFIFMTRSRRQQSISMVKIMRFAKAIRSGPIPDERMDAMRESIAAEEALALAELEKHGAPLLKVRFEDLIERTSPTVWRIADFLKNWNEREMIACVKPRSATVFNGMLELDLVAEREERTQAEKQQPYDPAKCTCSHPPYNPPCGYCENGDYDPATV